MELQPILNRNRLLGSRCVCYGPTAADLPYQIRPRYECINALKQKGSYAAAFFLSWELRGSNPRPSACKADALNQLS